MHRKYTILQLNKNMKTTFLGLTSRKKYEPTEIRTHRKLYSGLYPVTWMSTKTTKIIAFQAQAFLSVVEYKNPFLDIDYGFAVHGKGGTLNTKNHLR